MCAEVLDMSAEVSKVAADHDETVKPNSRKRRRNSTSTRKKAKRSSKKSTSSSVVAVPILTNQGTVDQRYTHNNYYKRDATLDKRYKNITIQPEACESQKPKVIPPPIYTRKGTLDQRNKNNRTYYKKDGTLKKRYVGKVIPYSSQAAHDLYQPREFVVKVQKRGAKKAKDLYLVIWDFDHSLMASESDFEVTALLAQKFIPQFADSTQDEIVKAWEREFFPRHIGDEKLSFKTFVNEKYADIHKGGAREDDYVKAVSCLNVFPENNKLVKQLHKQGVEQIIVSDGNEFVIKTWLKQQNLDQCFSAVYTHPTRFDGEGKFVVTQWSDLYDITDKYKESRMGRDWICKGDIVEEILQKKQPKMVCYVGDGLGDMPGVNALRAADVAFIRKGFPLAKKWTTEIEKDEVKRARFQCQRVQFWKNDDELSTLIRGNLAKSMW